MLDAVLSRYMLWHMSVCPSVTSWRCHNGRTDKAHYGIEAALSISYICVGREFGYLQKCWYFPLELCYKLWNYAMAH